MTHSTTASGRGHGKGVRGGILAVATAGMFSAGTVGVLGVAGLQDAGVTLDEVAALDAAPSEVRAIATSRSSVPGPLASYAWDARSMDGAAAAAGDTDRAGFLESAGFLDSADRLHGPLVVMSTERPESFEVWTDAASGAAHAQQSQARWVLAIAVAHGLVVILALSRTLVLFTSRRSARLLDADPAGDGGAAAEEAVPAASARSGAVSPAAEHGSGDVRTVAAPPEPTGAPIPENAASTAEAGEVTSAAGTPTGAGAGVGAKLADSSVEIGDVMKAVRSIAEQAGLLALNAVLEAARVDAAAEPVPVVASEDRVTSTRDSDRDGGRGTSSQDAASRTTEVAGNIAGVRTAA